MSADVIRAASPDLIRTAAQRRGWNRVMRQLGLAPTDENVVTFRARARELGVDISHLRRHGGLDVLSAEVLRDAAQGATSQAQVLARLGLSPGGGTYAALSRAAQANGVTLPARGPYAEDRRPTTRRCTDEQVRAAFEGARSIADVLRRLGLVPRGDNYRVIKNRLHELGLDVSQLGGRSWARGGNLSRTPLEELLVRGRPCSGPNLAKRLIEADLLPRECCRCHLDEWQGEPIPLELDHINGEHDDNRLGNLRLLCPNCHALTDTYRGRNIRRRRTLAPLPEC
jgi:hypothetical protein